MAVRHIVGELGHYSYSMVLYIQEVFDVEE